MLASLDIIETKLRTLKPSIRYSAVLVRGVSGGPSIVRHDAERRYYSVSDSYKVWFQLLPDLAFRILWCTGFSLSLYFFSSVARYVFFLVCCYAIFFLSLYFYIFLSRNILKRRNREKNRKRFWEFKFNINQEKLSCTQGTRFLILLY